MWDTETLQRARQAFAAQFEERDGVVTFRKRGKGDPATISGWDRDALIYDFNRRANNVYLVAAVVLIVILIAGAACGLLFHARLTLVGVIAVMAPVVFLYSAVNAWVWDAPRRLIASRAADSIGASKDVVSPN